MPPKPWYVMDPNSKAATRSGYRPVYVCWGDTIGEGVCLGDASLRPEVMARAELIVRAVNKELLAPDASAKQPSSSATRAKFPRPRKGEDDDY